MSFSETTTGVPGVSHILDRRNSVSNALFVNRNLYVSEERRDSRSAKDVGGCDRRLDWEGGLEKGCECEWSHYSKEFELCHV